MKYFSYLFLAALFIFAGCKSKHTGDNKALTSPFVLTYKLEKGNSYKYKIESKIIQDQEIVAVAGSRKARNEQDIVYNVTLKISDKEADGTLDFSMNFDKIKITAKNDKQTITYESGVTKDTAKTFVNYEALIDNPFDVRVSKQGEIFDVTKVDKIVNKLLDLSKQQVNPGQKEEIRKQLTDGFLKQVIGRIFREIPDNKMAKDSTWQKVQTPMPMQPFQISNTAKYRIKDVKLMNGYNIACIDAGLDYKVEGQRKISQQGMNYNFKDPIIVTSGEIQFDVNRGLTKKVNTTATITFEFTLDGKGPQGPVKMTQRQQSNNTDIVELIEE